MLHTLKELSLDIFLSFTEKFQLVLIFVVLTMCNLSIMTYNKALMLKSQCTFIPPGLKYPAQYKLHCHVHVV